MLEKSRAAWRKIEKLVHIAAATLETLPTLSVALAESRKEPPQRAGSRALVPLTSGLVVAVPTGGKEIAPPSPPPTHS